jgi:hypothetical protein
VDVQHQAVLEMQEQMLAVRRGVDHCVPVEQGGAGGKPALRTADGQLLAGEHITELPGETVDRMAFRHYSTISPVVS